MMFSPGKLAAAAPVAYGGLRTPRSGATRNHKVDTFLFQELTRRSTDCFRPGTSAGFWLGGQCPLAARGEENFENLTTKW